MKYQFQRSAQFDGRMVRAGKVIPVSAARIKEEEELGKHPETGEWISALLNHAQPVGGEVELQPTGKQITPLSATVPVSKGKADAMAEQARQEGIEQGKAEAAEKPERKKPGPKPKAK